MLGLEVSVGTKLGTPLGGELGYASRQDPYDAMTWPAGFLKH